MAKALHQSLVRKKFKEKLGPRLASTSDVEHTNHFDPPYNAESALHTMPRRVASPVPNVPLASTADRSSDAEVRHALRAVSDGTVKAIADEASLCKFYGLTRKEAALATILLKGKSVADAAAELRVSPRAARMYLKRIVMKADIDPRCGPVV